MKGKVIYTLVRIFFYNNLPESIQLTFRRWLTDEADQKEKHKAIERIWNAIDAAADKSTEKDLKLLHARIKAEYPEKKNTTTLYKSLIRAAAIFLLPLLGAFTTYLYMHKKEADKIEWTESFAAAGQRKEITLSDGSTVWLNSGSILIHAKEFNGKERSLYLNGEAIFEVAKNPGKPFIVKTNHINIEATGTIFNVEAYSDSEYTVATLKEGGIKVDMTEHESMTLLPDQQVRYHNSTGTAVREIVDADKVLQWKHGYITFQKASFDYIIQTLERKFDVRINYEANKFAEHSFNMKIYPGEDIYHILDIMKEMIPDLRHKTENNIIYIY
ncbi:MAG: FecR domain-containing protein [Tannerella sp.]|jgi:ferric-dicitrate binding protein FerR (iron transport regulator)|nr:FecR domain-containing protein [Tannerella sp.]